jgi:altronate dehydratase small subunit
MRVGAILLNKKDNVATALRDIEAGETVLVGVPDGTMTCRVPEPIDYGHKFAVIQILLGDHITKYGEVIGRATQNIAVGAHAHVQNIESLRGRGDLEERGR